MSGSRKREKDLPMSSNITKSPSPRAGEDWGEGDGKLLTVQGSENCVAIRVCNPVKTDIAIRVQNLSKCYQIYDTPRDRLKQFVAPVLQQIVGQSPKQYFREFWALKDVSFEIKKGESFGIIGRNGSGKSTLLQMICGTLNPTGGSIQTDGRIAAVLELGSGFNPDFTGRENIYLNGSVLGLTEDEIEACLEDILAFADIGDFIDQPVKTYSSGMFVRLAFAIQVNVAPEILIIDEALSVGDFFFQQKCFARMRKMREDGLTLLFVSHDMGTVRDLCAKAIYLSKGHTAFLGDSQDAIRAYLSSEGTHTTTAEVSAITAQPVPEDTVAPDNRLADAMKIALWQRDSNNLNDDHRLLAVVLLDEQATPVTCARIGGKLIFQVFFRTKSEEQGHIFLCLKNKYDHIVTLTGSSFMGMEPLSTKGSSYEVFEFEIDCMLEAGLYSIMVNFGILNAPNQGDVLDSTGWIGPMRVDWEYELKRAPFLGMFGLPCKGRLYGLHKPNKLMTSEEIITRSIITGKDRSGAGGMEIIAACVTDNNGASTFTVKMTEELRFYIYARALRTIDKPYFAIVLYNQLGELIFTGTTVQVMGYSPKLSEGQSIVVGFKVGMTIQAGQYTFRLSCAQPLEVYHPNKGTTLDAYGSLGPLTVLFDYERQRAPFYGIAQLPMEML